MPLPQNVRVIPTGIQSFRSYADPYTHCWAAKMNRHRVCAIALVILTTASLNSFAGTPPPIAPFDAITWKATMKKRPSASVRMGSFRVRFEETTLDDVRRAARIGDLAHQGDAGESAYWLCYTNMTATVVERIWIIAHGEMGAPKHFVTNISAELLPIGGATPDCPALPKSLKPLSLDNSLWLNASLGDVHSRLGTPSYRKGPWRSYDYQGKVPGKCEGEGFDLMNWLWLRFDKGRVKSLFVGQVTSC